MKNKETLEDLMINNGYHDKDFDDIWREGVKAGVEWEAKRRYNEEEVKKLIIDFLFEKGIGREVKNVEEWFKQFKKK